MKVRRVLEYEGEDERVRATLEASYVQGVKWICRGGGVDNTIREVSRDIVDPDRPVDLSRTDEYLDGVVPDVDVETCLKVLRTVRNQAFGPHWFDADVAVVLSCAHARIVELTRRALENEYASDHETEGQSGPAADAPTVV